MSIAKKWIGLGALLVIAAGCSSDTANENVAKQGKPSEAGTQYLMSTAPEAPEDVIPLREHVENEQDVVVVGRIGGSVDPWVEGLAAFSIVDRSLAACSDIPGDGCETPWDYCCVTDKLPAATTLVKVVDADGQVVETGARELLGLSELQTVVVSGKAQKDDAGNITILASKIFVDPANPGQIKRGDDDGADHHAHDHDHDHDHDHNKEHQHDHDDHKHEKSES